MRLINADRLRDAFLGMPNCYNGFSDTYDKAMIVDMVDEQPTIDAVPVIRCKHCKHYKQYQSRGMYCTRVIGAEYPRKEDDYCSDGERF